MSPRPMHDRWLLPTRQADYPSRPPVRIDRLHARRESVFLALATAFVAAAAALQLLGVERAIDLSAALGDPALPVRLVVPRGALLFPLSFIAAHLACELYGRRRAGALVAAGLVASAALFGLSVATGAAAAPGPDQADALAAGAALLAGAAVAHDIGLFVFDALGRAARGRHRWVRHVSAALIGQLTGWGAFALALVAIESRTAGAAPDALARIASFGAGGCAAAVACIVACAVPFSAAAWGLALLLRVRPFEAAEERSPLRAVAAPGGEPAFVAARPQRPSKPPFSSAEVAFFDAGDQLEADADESFSDLSASGSGPQ